MIIIDMPGGWIGIDADDWHSEGDIFTFFKLACHRCDLCWSIGIALFGVHIVVGIRFGEEEEE